MPQRSHSMPAMAAASEDIDYDAPTDRAMGVGNIVRSPQQIMGLEIPPFLAKLLKMDQPDDRFEVGNIVEEMDEECYLGKDGDFDECVDFDPVA